MSIVSMVYGAFDWCVAYGLGVDLGVDGEVDDLLLVVSMVSSNYCLILRKQLVLIGSQNHTVGCLHCVDRKVTQPLILPWV